jgi:hypothetical protein
VRQLKEIKRELKAIESNTSIGNWFWHGILSGAGWIVGSLIALLIIGWGLSFLGIIPGLNRIVVDLNNAFSHIGRSSY